jgi:two-component system phosphate regulon sensor histidine kinase PhoR
MKLLNKNYINAIFFLIANIVLLFFIQFELVLLLLIYEVIAILFVKKYFENKLRDKQKSKDITHNGSIEKEITLDFFDQYSSAVFVLRKDYTIYTQNLSCKSIYGEQKDKDILSIIRDYDFIVQFEKFKKNNSYSVFNWSKPLPTRKYFKTEIFEISKFYIVIVTDITFDKIKEEQQGDNLTSLTHELKTPLSVIIGYLETIDFNNLSNKENQKYLDIINTKTFQIRDLIDQTLKLAEIESLSIQKISNDLHSLLEKALDNYSILFKKKDIQLHIDISTSREIFFDFTPNDFDFILNNLLSNALKYTPAGKNVYVTTKKLNNKISIIIKDEGIGISQTDLDKITTKFFRADQSRNSETGGHGLGLAIVDKLLSKNGHKLEFSSVLGEGSTFKIDLLLS